MANQRRKKAGGKTEAKPAPAASKAGSSGGAAQRAPTGKKAAPARAVVKSEPAAKPVAAPTSPLGLVRRFGEQLDRAFADFRREWSLFPSFDALWEGRREVAWLPAVEMLERGGKLVIRAELPGLTKDDVTVELRENALSIHGERRHAKDEKRQGFYRSERSYGSFYREVPLPEGVDPEKATASFKNGVLEVTVPAPSRPPSSGRSIPVES